jgi:Hydroxypyruvate isomerase
MKLSVCIDAVTGSMKPGESIRKVAALGVPAFEFWAWWGKDLDEINDAIADTGLVPAALCTKFVSLTEPSLRDEYIVGLKETIVAAKKIGCTRIISQVGADTGASRESQHTSLVRGLVASAPYLEESGMTLVIEPLNTKINHKGYYLYSGKESFEIIDEVDSPAVKLLYDIYHQQIMDGDIIRSTTENIDKIAHFHAAGNPGRNELDNGELNYHAIFKAIDKAGYTGYAGLEYWPLEPWEDGIKRFL